LIIYLGANRLKHSFQLLFHFFPMIKNIFNLQSIVFILLIFAPSSAYTAVGDTVFMKGFGLMPNSRQNAVRPIQLALDSCRKMDHPVLLFEKGRYDFWPQYAVEKDYYESNSTDINPKRCAIWIDQFNNLSIDAAGSDFIFHDRIQPFTIDHSTNVSVKNVQIDWDIPLTAQAVVVDTSSTFIDINIDSVQFPHIIEKGKLVFVGEGWKSEWWGTMEFESSSGLIRPGTGDEGVLGANWQNYTATALPSGITRLQFPFTRKPAIGNVLVLRHSERDHAGIFITNSKGIALDSITIYHTAGLGVLSQYSGDLHFRSLHVVPNLSKKRVFSGHDDGCHFSNCKGAIVVENSSFRGLMDDPINIHGTAVQVVEKLPGNQLLCRFMHEQSVGMEWGFVGDTIGFIDHSTMQTIARGVITKFEARCLTDFILTFDKPVPAALNVKDALENLTFTPSVEIRNSLFSVNRARGILVSTPRKVLIEDNRFESSGSAILIAGDANQWFESGAVSDVTIRRNDFTDACLTSMYQFCEAIISIEPEIPNMLPSKPFHRNINIRENQFHPFDYPVLYAKSTSGISFVDNTITRSTRFAPFHARKSMLSFVACSKIVVSGNRLVGEVLGKNILLTNTNRKELKSQGLRVDLH
jgi:hypothetical protein